MTSKKVTVIIGITHCTLICHSDMNGRSESGWGNKCIQILSTNNLFQLQAFVKFTVITRYNQSQIKFH